MLFNLLADAQETPQNNWGTLIILGVIVVAFVGFMIWQNHQNKKKAKEQEDAINKLQKGDKIITIGGICGFLVEMNEEENTFILETGSDTNKSYIKFDRQAIYQTVSMVQPPVEEVVEEKAEVTIIRKPKVKEEVKEEPAKEEAVVEEKVEAVEPAKEETPKKKTAKKSTAKKSTAKKPTKKTTTAKKEDKKAE